MICCRAGHADTLHCYAANSFSAPLRDAAYALPPLICGMPLRCYAIEFSLLFIDFG